MFKKFIETIFQFIHKHPRLFSLIGIKDLKPDIEDERDDVMGAEPRFNWEILKTNGDWVEPFKNIDWEIQKWMDCTGHSIKNTIEQLAWVKFGEKWKISEAYINGMAGTNRWKGNSMRTILQAIRKYGIVWDKDWPAENRWKIIPQNVIDKGLAWGKKYDFGYDEVTAVKLFDEAIKFSPLYGGGYAWSKKGMLYYSCGRANHCFNLLKNKMKIAGDSYNPHIKHLDESYKIVWPRIIYLGKKKPEYNKQWIDYLMDKRKVNYVQRTDGLNGGKGEVYKIFKYGYKELTAKEKLEKGIKSMADNKIMIGVNEQDFYKLLK